MKYGLGENDEADGDMYICKGKKETKGKRSPRMRSWDRITAGPYRSS